ncbi:possible colicin V production protein [Gracilibacillus boraciitolerans JCM 21714]|uniref:Possible colicin V production protein n=1 Tax=Gracilibacillus boraciitolerans JCM 21714 TaxID=1298598 RepID=W4VH26_9BACI|nr:CvpA family protein [Gracilibacillus boraciitolerans]GAE92710.1 possible colicin V production protein [Gracilibacillus boraciitolerans JCM 21714]
MVNIILIFLLIVGIFVGLRRGFILQVLHLIGFIVAFIVAAIYYDNLASKLELWIPYPEFMSDASWAVFLESLPLEAAYYNAIAFGALFFVTKIILQIVATMLDFVADLPILRLLNSWLGAILGFVEVYLLLFVVLYILALAPVAYIQELIDSSSIAAFIIEETPVLSDKIATYWFENDPFSK